MSKDLRGEISVQEVEYDDELARDKYDPKSGVKRGLKVRHIAMMAFAGIIGPGAFIGMGTALNSGGPAGLLAGFSVVALLVMAVMLCIGELNTMFEFNFCTHASRWIDPAFGAAVGWCYVILWGCNIISEYVSTTSVLSYYSTKVPIYGYFLILWGCFSVYQMFGVDVFGEVEYFLAILKIVFISGFYLFAIIYASGGIKDHSPGNPFKELPLADGFAGFASSFVYAGVFLSGVESLSMTFQESKNVRKSVKLAVRQTVFRIFYVYFGLIIAYGITVPYNDPGLASTATTMRAPMTIALTNAGWANGGYFVSTVVFITSLSSINSAIYICARALTRLAVEGHAPKIFSTVNKNGVPWVSVQTVHLVGFLSLLSMSSGSSVAYSYIVNVGGVCTFIVWTSIVFAQYRFRRGWVKQGNDVKDLHFKSPLFPYLNFFGMGLGVVLTLVQGWTVFSPFDVNQFVDVYIMLPAFVVIWLIMKLILKSKWVKYEEMDFTTDRLDLVAPRSEKVEEEEQDVETDGDKKKNFIQRVWQSM